MPLGLPLPSSLALTAALLAGLALPMAASAANAAEDAAATGGSGLRALAVAALHHDARFAEVTAEIAAAEMGKALARANDGLTLDVDADIGRSDLRTAAPFPASGIRTPNTLSLGASLPLFTSGRTAALEEAAARNVEVALQKRRDVGGKLILAALVAVLDTKRDRETLRLSEASWHSLMAARDDVQKRLKVGEATRTDLAQAEGRAAEAQANVSRAAAQLRVSEIGLERLVGVEQAGLDPEWPAQLPLAATEAEAVRLSHTAPAVVSAAAATAAAKSDVTAVRAEGKPRLTLDGHAATQDDTDFGYDRLSTWGLQFKLKVPILTGGLVAARVGQAEAKAEIARYAAADEAAFFAETAAREWAILQATEEVIHASQSQLKAAELAEDGVRKELAVGSRTTLDLLDSERELLAGQVAVVSAQHDHAVTAFRLLAACGTLELYNVPE